MITLQERLKAMGWTPCLMLINTILVERTIEQQKLLDKLSFEDLRTLTLLFYEHVNPYGQFELDLERPFWGGGATLPIPPKISVIIAFYRSFPPDGPIKSRMYVHNLSPVPMSLRNALQHRESRHMSS